LIITLHELTCKLGWGAMAYQLELMY